MPKKNKYCCNSIPNREQTTFASFVNNTWLKCFQLDSRHEPTHIKHNSVPSSLVPLTPYRTDIRFPPTNEVVRANQAVGARKSVRRLFADEYCLTGHTKREVSAVLLLLSHPFNPTCSFGPPTPPNPCSCTRNEGQTLPSQALSWR